MQDLLNFEIREAFHGDTSRGDAPVGEESADTTRVRSAANSAGRVLVVFPRYMDVPGVYASRVRAHFVQDMPEELDSGITWDGPWWGTDATPDAAPDAPMSDAASEAGLDAAAFEAAADASPEGAAGGGGSGQSGSAGAGAAGAAGGGGTGGTAGAPTDAGGAVPASSSDDGGCGCSVSSKSMRRVWILLFAAGVFVLRRRRARLTHPLRTSALARRRGRSGGRD